MQHTSGSSCAEFMSVQCRAFVHCHRELVPILMNILLHQPREYRSPFGSLRLSLQAPAVLQSTRHCSLDLFAELASVNHRRQGVNPELKLTSCAGGSRSAKLLDPQRLLVAVLGVPPLHEPLPRRDLQHATPGFSTAHDFQYGWMHGMKDCWHAAVRLRRSGLACAHASSQLQGKPWPGHASHATHTFVCRLCTDMPACCPASASIRRP
jgi:hypothetical protein